MKENQEDANQNIPCPFFFFFVWGNAYQFEDNKFGSAYHDHQHYYYYCYYSCCILSSFGAESKKQKQPPAPAAAIHRNEGTKQDETKNINAQTFTFRELAAATKNFRQECLLGEGGFGRVYKGTLQSNGQVI